MNLPRRLDERTNIPQVLRSSAVSGVRSRWSDAGHVTPQSQPGADLPPAVAGIPDALAQTILGTFAQELVQGYAEFCVVSGADPGDDPDSISMVSDHSFGSPGVERVRNNEQPPTFR